MKEPTVTIKLTLSELARINGMISLYEKSKSDVGLLASEEMLKKELKKIEEWIYEEKRKAIIDKRASEGSFNKEAKVETIKGVCIPCDD